MNISSLANQLPNNLLSSQESRAASQEVLRTSAPQVSPTSESSQSALEKRQSALQLVDETLSRAYQKISSRGMSAAESYQVFEPLTAEKVANNILGFIERRLRMDQAEGASQEELQARLEAGLSGFKKGFAEAEEKLKALDMLSPEVSADIVKTYKLVTEGIDKLREQLLGSGLPAEETQAQQPVSWADASSRLTAFSQLDAAVARDFSFELTTREGDRVRINASASQSLGMAYNAAANGNVEAEGSYSNSQSFLLEIQGELNEEELSAINDLLGKVNNLAADFYAGDMDKAWDQALALGFDQEQISEYSFSLTQVEIVQATYEVVDAETAAPSSLTAAQGFMKSFLDVLDKASLFSEPFKLLEQLVAGVDGVYPEEKKGSSSFTDFMSERIAERLAKNE